MTTTNGSARPATQVTGGLDSVLGDIGGGRAAPRPNPEVVARAKRRGVADGESAELAKRLIADTCAKQGIEPGQLTIHADRGSSMTSKPVAFLMADLGITKTHSRTHVSDDSPYSESHFRTLKYRPGFPDRFGSMQDSRSFSQDFFAWYNEEHRHSGLGLLSPAVVHYGLAPAAIAQRRAVLDAAYSAHPERFVRKPPEPLPAPTEVWINRPQPSENKSQ